MWEIVGGMAGVRGVRRARRVLESLDARLESAGKTRARLVLAHMKGPQPEMQAELNVEGYTYCPDSLWREHRLIVEFDGDAKYFAYWPTPQFLLAERKREGRFMEAGWRS